MIPQGAGHPFHGIGTIAATLLVGSIGASLLAIALVILAGQLLVAGLTLGLRPR